MWRAAASVAPMSAWGRLARTVAAVAVREAPGLLRRATAATRSSRRAGTRAPGGLPRRGGPSPGRSLAYAPQPDGRADPGEVVWTWVAYEEQDGRGKDRPVLVVGRDGATLLGLQLSSQAERQGDRDWLALGPGAWDREQRPSWVRLDRVLEVAEDGIRREGAVLDRARFEQVAERLRSSYGW